MTAAVKAQPVDVDSAVESFLAAYASASDNPAELERQRTVLAEAFAQAGAPALAREILAAADFALQQQKGHRRTDERMNLPAMGPSIAAAVWVAEQDRMRALVNKAVAMVRDTELQSAQHAADDVLREYDLKRAQLSEAIAAADVDTVTALRNDVEIILPKRLADAEQALADAKVAAAERDLARLEAELKPRQAVLADRTAARIAAWTAFEQATADENDAGRAVESAQQQLNQGRLAVRQLRSDRRDLAAAHTAAVTERQHRIAGAKSDGAPVLELVRYLD